MRYTFKNPIKKRNPVARELITSGKYKGRVIKDKNAWRRKPKHPKQGTETE